MPFVKLTNGHEVKVRVFHAEFDTTFGPRRGTGVTMSMDGNDFEVNALCHPNDQFSRKLGRNRAANKLMEVLRDSTRLNKENRRRIFSIICPEFPQTKKVRHVS